MRETISVGVSFSPTRSRQNENWRRQNTLLSPPPSRLGLRFWLSAPLRNGTEAIKDGNQPFFNFIYIYDAKKSKEWMEARIRELKEDVREILGSTTDTMEMLHLIDTIEHLL
ncbi:Terpene synthase [Carex littledalei]|uniref:Terpene synthase n=1 Tax=Carex littledalei TaxID=544730 RepID=A0A833QX47_9POAL|nr:Terpene synthase [Carex littledalei]